MALFPATILLLLTLQYSDNYELLNCGRYEDGTYLHDGMYMRCYNSMYVLSKMSTGSDGDTYRQPFLDGTLLLNNALDVETMLDHDKNVYFPKPEDWVANTKFVHIILLDDDSNEVVHLKFSPGTDHTNWFSKYNVLESPWELDSSFSGNDFTLIGCCDRWFYISRNHGGCNADRGLLAFITGRVCSWVTRYLVDGVTHAILYSKTTSNWNDAPNWYSQPELIGVASHALFLLEQYEPDVYVEYEAIDTESRYKVTVNAPELQTIELGPERQYFEDMCGLSKDILDWEEDGTKFSTFITFDEANHCFDMKESNNSDGTTEYFSFLAGMIVTYGEAQKFYDIRQLAWEKTLEGVIGISFNWLDFDPVSFSSNVHCCENELCEGERSFGCHYGEEKLRNGPIIIKLKIEDSTLPTTCNIEFQSAMTRKVIQNGDMIAISSIDNNNYEVVASAYNGLVVKFENGVPIPGESGQQENIFVTDEDPTFSIVIFAEIAGCGTTTYTSRKTLKEEIFSHERKSDDDDEGETSGLVADVEFVIENDVDERNGEQALNFILFFL